MDTSYKAYQKDPVSLVNAAYPRPVTKNRDKLLRALLDQGISNAELSEIVSPMQGKAQEEKERIAAQIMKDRGIQ